MPGGRPRTDGPSGTTGRGWNRSNLLADSLTCASGGCQRALEFFGALAARHPSGWWGLYARDAFGCCGKWRGSPSGRLRRDRVFGCGRGGHRSSGWQVLRTLWKASAEHRFRARTVRESGSGETAGPGASASGAVGSEPPSARLLQGSRGGSGTSTAVRQRIRTISPGEHRAGQEWQRFWSCNGLSGRSNP